MHTQMEVTGVQRRDHSSDILRYEYGAAHTGNAKQIGRFPNRGLRYILN